MAEYLALIYEDEASWASADPDTFQEMLGRHQKFGEAFASTLRGGNALQPTSTATTIRTDATGSATVTDGPFAETKEALGGYYLIEAADLDEAIDIAKNVPAPYGCVELRPIMALS